MNDVFQSKSVSDFSAMVTKETKTMFMGRK